MLPGIRCPVVACRPTAGRYTWRARWPNFCCQTSSWYSERERESVSEKEWKRERTERRVIIESRPAFDRRRTPEDGARAHEPTNTSDTQVNCKLRETFHKRLSVGGEQHNGHDIVADVRATRRHGVGKNVWRLRTVKSMRPAATYRSCVLRGSGLSNNTRCWSHAAWSERGNGGNTGLTHVINRTDGRARSISPTARFRSDSVTVVQISASLSSRPSTPPPVRLCVYARTRADEKTLYFSAVSPPTQPAEKRPRTKLVVNVSRTRAHEKPQKTIVSYNL